ncbi:CGNR zinc finger domain-containing protein [Williamsia sterculiae]|uniref:CGNR zinc finger domain-containing protein n=1 Tax=Williamsia sterculiae TaxID=1344003 RepID=A0A1N7GWF8_9NOCA|nr:CGNR zinc finger domain-containing protein [Williamsia sterculiae]SIS16899.1 CGNR zinc finger domain-containing protein [Williamsia sterculiae]
MDEINDEDLLLALLNSAPVVDGTRTDTLDGPGGAELVARFDGTGSPAESTRLRQMRGALQGAIRDQDDALGALDALLEDATLIPEVTTEGIHWNLQVPPDQRIAVRAALAWAAVVDGLPGRLRPCANSECNLFLIDRSRPGTAKWCSMATCGNRMKARTHAHRRRTS